MSGNLSNYINVPKEYLGLSNVKIERVIANVGEEKITIRVISTINEVLCGKCNMPTKRYEHGILFKFRHFPIFGKETVIEIMPRRGRCHHCDGYPITTQYLEWYGPNNNITKPYERYLKLCINKCKKAQVQILAAFPKALAIDVKTVLDILPIDNNDYIIDTTYFTVTLNDECLIVPNRIYFHEPLDEMESNLTHVQKIILNCIYLLHYDGYIRQKRLEKIMNENHEWIVPFVMHLLGEYVYEILIVIEQIINEKNIYDYAMVAKNNHGFMQKIENNMSNYWGRFYKSTALSFKHYIGRKIVKKIRRHIHFLRTGQ